MSLLTVQWMHRFCAYRRSILLSNVQAEFVRLEQEDEVGNAEKMANLKDVAYVVGTVDPYFSGRCTPEEILADMKTLSERGSAVELRGLALSIVANLAMLTLVEGNAGNVFTSEETSEALRRQSVVVRKAKPEHVAKLLSLVTILASRDGFVKRALRVASPWGGGDDGMLERLAERVACQGI